jgi:hypothetical protein
MGLVAAFFIMYDKSEILEQALKAIQENELTTISEVVSYVPCKESILYETEEWKLEVLEPIKKSLNDMKVSLKAKMKKEWRKAASNPSLQIAAFKLMADDDEMVRLSTSINKNEHTGKDGKELFPELTDEQVKDRVEELIKKHGQ